MPAIISVFYFEMRLDEIMVSANANIPCSAAHRSIQGSSCIPPQTLEKRSCTLLGEEIPTAHARKQYTMLEWTRLSTRATSPPRYCLCLSLPRYCLCLSVSCNLNPDVYTLEVKFPNPDRTPYDTGCCIFLLTSGLCGEIPNFGLRPIQARKQIMEIGGGTQS